MYEYLHRLEPWFDRLPNGKDITLRSLLNHTSGLPEYFETNGFVEAMKANTDREWTPSERMAFVLDAKPLFAVGKGWSYADTNYILVGMVAELAAGMPLFDEIDRRLLKPLKLSGIVPSDRQQIAGLVTGYADQRNPLGFNGRMLVGTKLVVNPQLDATNNVAAPPRLAGGRRKGFGGTLYTIRISST